MTLYGQEYEPPPEWALDPDGEPPPPPPPLYADIAALLAGGLPEPPRPACLRREDGHALFYAGKVNVLFGDPESGKTLVACCAAAETLRAGRRVAFIDVDHNGVREIVARLLTFGAPKAALTDPARFRYYEPEDGDELIHVVRECQEWRPAVAVIDSIGEILPMLGLSSNSPDDYTAGHRRVLTAIANAGAAVIAVDHLPKSEDARAHGQTGTMAKRRAVNGASYRVTIREAFAPGKGGSASLVVHKDRPGGVRATCPADGKHQPAGLFVIECRDGATSWKVTAPRLGDTTARPDDVAELDALDPPPTSVRDVKQRMKWGEVRAQEALRAYRAMSGEVAS